MDKKKNEIVIINKFKENSNTDINATIIKLFEAFLITQLKKI